MPSVADMPTRRPSPEHQEAVSRRLALLSAELASARPGAAAGTDELDDEGSDWSAGHTRIRPLRSPEAAEHTPAVAFEPEPPPVPVPGRHAARRAGRALRDAVPTTLRGRVVLGPAQLAVVAVLVALGLAVTCWWVLRGAPDRLEAPSLTSSSTSVAGADPGPDVTTPPGSDLASGLPPPEESAESGTVTVDVAGKVRHPGIAVLDAGSRVVDALEAAGGARRGVDLSGLNLARVLTDGEQILVGQPAPTGVAASAAASPGAPGTPLVNINTASQAELEELPEVGPVTAQAILSWRDEHGGFTSVDELLEVDGIGDATLGQLAPYVTV